MTYVIVLVVAAIALFGVVLYNSLVKSRQMAEEAWSGIDVQLKRRADLIPNLIETVKGYAAHEKTTLEGVIAMVANGLGSSVVPARGVENEFPTTIRTIPFGSPPLTGASSICRPRSANAASIPGAAFSSSSTSRASASSTTTVMGLSKRLSPAKPDEL